MLDKRKFYINGEWVDPIVPNELKVINPATEKPVAVITMGTAADIDRAVAAANGRNKIAIVVPCHRIIGSNGSLTGYGNGLPMKEYLLNLEQNHR